MKAARIHEYTEDLTGAFSIDEVDYPAIADPTDVIVEVEAAGWCQTDNHIIEGWFEEVADVDLPRTLGHENAGVVEEVGERVSSVAPGDPVVVHPAISCGKCRPCRLGNEMYCDEHRFCGMDIDGGFAEYLKVPERSLICLESIGPSQAAPHADAGLTAYRATKKAAADLVPGDLAVLVGIGGLGHIGLQILDAISTATIVAVDIRDEALDMAQDLGAYLTVNPRDEDPIETIHGTFGGADTIIDYVGSDETLGYGLGLLGQGGTHHVVGYEGTLQVPAHPMVGLELEFAATLCGTYTELQELIELVEGGEITVETSEYPLEDINKVATEMARGAVDGRAIIRP